MSTFIASFKEFKQQISENEIETLNYKNQYKNDKIHFFVPKFLLFLKKTTLEVLTYESKENTDWLILKDQK